MLGQLPTAACKATLRRSARMPVGKRRRSVPLASHSKKSSSSQSRTDASREERIAGTYTATMSSPVGAELAAERDWASWARSWEF